jgi:hypothetical protein
MLPAEAGAMAAINPSGIAVVINSRGKKAKPILFLIASSGVALAETAARIDRPRKRLMSTL